MRKIICLIALVSITFSCDPKPEGYDANGRPYITKKVCVKSHTEKKRGYHFGYSAVKGKVCYHYGSYTETICDESKIDTTFLKVKTKKSEKPKTIQKK